MLTKTDIARGYDTILSIPGMNETVKIDLRISRKNVLLLNHVIERGLYSKSDDETGNLLSSMTSENLDEIKVFANDCLQKAGLNELRAKLNSFGDIK